MGSQGSENASFWNLQAPDPGAAGQILSPFVGGGLKEVVFPAGERWPVIGGLDDVYLWRLELAGVVEIACWSVGRNLTMEKGDRYFADEAYRRTCSELPPGRRVPAG